MELNKLNEMIDELETSEPSFSNIRNLSSLYIVKSHLLGDTNYLNATVKELNDILPSYLQYLDTKRRYQLHEINEDSIAIQLNQVCKELNDFLHLLYSSTDTTNERAVLNNFIENLKETF